MYLISELKCPYCHRQLLKEPKKKAICKECEKSFRVVTRPSDKQKVTATEEECQAFQFYVNLANLYSKEGGFKKDFGIEKERLKKQFGKDPSEQDVLWGLANHLVIEKAKKEDFGGLSGLYLNMALYLHQIGKPCFALKQQSEKMVLMSYKGVYGKVQIMANSCCGICKKEEGKIFSLDEALKKLPIPVKNCTNKINEKAPDGWCVCACLPSF